MAVIALHQAVQRVCWHAGLMSRCRTNVRVAATSAKDLRDALEHIDERVEGMLRGRIDPAASEIFDQGDFIDSGGEGGRPLDPDADQSAQLSVARLWLAKLRDADLSGASLTMATLNGADLGGADLSGAC